MPPGGWTPRSGNSYVTSKSWRARRLGLNDSADVDRTTVVDMLTGNNLLTTEESERRIVSIYLNAGMSQPWTRTFDFDPISRVSENRPYYLSAVAGLVQHWLAEGRPAGPRVTAWGGFERWSRLTSGILHSAGVSGFGESGGREASARVADDGTLDFVRSWWGAHGPDDVLVKNLREFCDDETVRSSQALTAYVKRLLDRVYAVDGLTQVRPEMSGVDHRGTRYFRLSVER